MSKRKTEIEVRREAPSGAVGGEAWPSFLSLRDEIDRLFDEFGSGAWRGPLSRRMQALMPAGGELAVRPATELVECGAEYRITAELPGMAAGDVDVKLGDGVISVRGEKSEERKEEKDDYLLGERRYGAVQRTLPLPPGIDAEAVTASFANGVLTVTLPKSAEARQKERKVEVRAVA
jgi:HSP20 family protein